MFWFNVGLRAFYGKCLSPDDGRAVINAVKKDFCVFYDMSTIS